MRVGEALLLKLERIDPWVLRTRSKNRLRRASAWSAFLVGRAHRSIPTRAPCPSEQLGYPAAMQRHLERRDPSLIRVPAQLGGRWVVLPLGCAAPARRSSSRAIRRRSFSRARACDAALDRPRRHSGVPARAPRPRGVRPDRTAEEPLPQIVPTSTTSATSDSRTRPRRSRRGRARSRTSSPHHPGCRRRARPRRSVRSRRRSPRSIAHSCGVGRAARHGARGAPVVERAAVHRQR